MHKRYRKIGLLFILIFSLASITACGNSGIEDDETIKIRMANQVDKSNFLNVGYEKFKALLEEKSDGKFEVEIYNGGTLAGSDEEIVESIKTGIVDVSTSSAYGTANTTGVKALNLFDMPMIFDNREEFYNLLDGEFGEIIKQEIDENTSVQALGFIDLGFYGILNSKRPIEQPSDMKGLKIRTSEASLHLDTLKAMGANPTPMSYSEVFTGLQQGAIDGVSTTTPLIHGDRFYEVSEYMTLTNQLLLPHVLMVNDEFYEGLPEDMQIAFDEAAEEYIAYARELSVEAEEKAITEMEEEGATVVELSSDQMEDFKEIVEPVIEKHIDTVGREHFEKAMEQLKK